MTGLRFFIGRVNAILARGAAWQGWPLTILILGTFGVTFRLYDMILYVLSLQASIATAVSDIRQREAQMEDARRRLADEKRDALLHESVEAITATLVDVRAITDGLMDMAEAAERRDKIAAKRDKMILTALESRGDLYDFLTKGGTLPHYDKQRKTTRRSGTDRKAHGRPNRKRP